ncbi:ketosynthase [Salinisphaera sp. LB1]|uniref:COG4648 family protein n=1 Tax=Salinisphaera sp. LB1 TaxID=2183911 RepID=UPI000D7068E8|nr:ketosynthase [Salinisphaera sp. LB1]AWN17481.1 hypothetical protein SALB1_3287 [Salinisphaera sp. LB1]
MRRLGFVAGLVPLLYPVLVHAAVVTGWPGLRFLALAVLIVNVLGPWLIRRRPVAWLAMFVLIAIAALSVHTVDALVFFYATPVLICLALAWLFGRTLLPGQTPLITLVARAIRGPLPGPVARYTRAVTIFWCATMLVMALANLCLALFASAEIWSLCANFLNYLIVGLLFVAEWFVRRRAIGEYEHMSWRQYMAALRRIDYRDLRHG